MRRFQALLIAAGLAAAPTSALAGSSQNPASTTTIERFEWSTSKGRLGVMVMSLTPELRNHFGAPDDRGVLVAQVAPSTPAAAAGIEVGDVLVEVHGKGVGGASDVLSAIADATKGTAITIRLVRDGKATSVRATLTDEPPPRVFDLSSRPLDWWRDFMKPFTREKQALTPFPFGEGWFRELQERLNAKEPVVKRS